MSKPSLPQGTRDFGAETVYKRNYIFNTIRSVFELYGFQPLETPAMEQLQTLMGKYGEEGDKLIFKILNNGLGDADKEQSLRSAFELALQGKNTPILTERALRYDLTIPFARYVAMNHGKLTFPFKRYQMQPVWRADRPQRGRYREFYQCDADVVGSRSLINEVELVAIYQTVFRQLCIPVEIRINNRKILAALAEICGGADKMVDITTAIDKLDKIGLDKVKEELTERGLNANQISVIAQFLNISGSNTEKLATLEQLVAGNETGLKGIEEIRWILNYEASLQEAYSSTAQGNRTLSHVKTFDEFVADDKATGASQGNQSSISTSLIVDLTLARGLNYYTGTIFEVKAIGVAMGSIGGGGRYDDLTGLFDVPGIPGVGISFGVDRIYDVLETLDAFPKSIHAGTQVLFFNLGEAESAAAFRLMQQLRARSVRCELYHDTTKFDKQFKYAEKKLIRYAVIIGSQELAAGKANVKDLQTGKQETVGFGGLVEMRFE